MKNETLDNIHKLWSSHGNFSDKEISGSDFETIINASVRAANASGKQSYSIIAIEDKKVMEQILPFPASKALIFCVDYTRIVDTAAHINCSYDAADTYSFMSGSIDTCLAAQNAALAAGSLGINSLFTNYIHRKLDNVFKILNLPKELCFPMVALLLGYSNTEPGHFKERLKGPGIIHYGKYHRAASHEMDEILDRYDDPDMGLYLFADWREKGFSHYLEAFYKGMSRFAGKMQKEYSNQIFERLVKCGFVSGNAKKGKQ